MYISESDKIFLMREKDNHLEGLRDLCIFLNNLGISDSIVEIGAYMGEGTVIFAEYFKEVITIDPWISGYDENDKTSHSNMIKVESMFDERVKDFKNIKKMKTTSKEASLLFPKKSIGFVYLDGNHTYKYVKEDLSLWIEKVKYNYIGGHDFSSKNAYGVVQAVLETFSRKNVKKFKDTSWVAEINKILRNN